MSSNFQELSSANGWSNSYGQPYKALTYSLRKVSYVGTSGQCGGIASANKVNVSSKVKIIYQGVSLGGNTGYGWLCANNSKAWTDMIGDALRLDNNTLSLAEISVNANCYPVSNSSHARQIDWYALWYE